MRTVITRKTLGVTWDEQRVQACLIRSGIAEFVIEELMIVPRELDSSGHPIHGAGEDLKAVTDRIGPDVEICVAALPEGEIMYRKLARPFADRRKILETIGPEVENLLPVMDSKLLVDFVLLGRDAAGAHMVQALCARTSSVQELVDVFKGSGLDPETVDCPSVAVASGARTLFDLPADKGMVVMHMGWSETSLAILSGSSIRHVGALPYGFERIASAHAPDGAAARTVDMEGIRTYGVDGGDLLAGLFREVLITLTKGGELGGDQILLATGYTGFIRDFGKKAEDMLGMKVQSPPMGDVRFRVRMDELLEGFLSFSLACRGIDGNDAVNFRQGELGLSRRFKKIMGDAGPWMKAAAVLLVIWILGLGLDVYLKSHTDAVLTEKINAEFSAVMPKGTPMVDPVKQMEQYLARLSGRTGNLETAAAGSPLDILKDLSAGIPKDMDVIIDTLNIDDESITLSASTGKYDDVERVQTILAKLPYIREVKIISANVDKNDQKVKMKLVCKR
ncbi:MAG TPA: pilus assembly protein PilM [Desulfomonilia bacterium]|nr:pilus assembly protein PilM [Desulfomonilia bacterium]